MSIFLFLIKGLFMLNYSLDSHIRRYETNWSEKLSGLVVSPYACRHAKLSLSAKTPSKYRLGHRIIATIQFIPVLGALASLIERIVVGVYKLFNRPTYVASKPTIAKSGITSVNKNKNLVAFDSAVDPFHPIEANEKNDEKAPSQSDVKDNDYKPEFIDLSKLATVISMGIIDLKEVIYIRFNGEYYGINKSDFEKSSLFQVLVSDAIVLKPHQVLDLSKLIAEDVLDKLDAKIFKAILQAFIDGSMGKDFPKPENEQALENQLFLALYFDCAPLKAFLKDHIEKSLLTVDFVQKRLEKCTQAVLKEIMAPIIKDTNGLSAIKNRLVEDIGQLIPIVIRNRREYLRIDGFIHLQQGTMVLNPNSEESEKYASNKEYCAVTLQRNNHALSAVAVKPSDVAVKQSEMRFLLNAFPQPDKRLTPFVMIESSKEAKFYVEQLVKWVEVIWQRCKSPTFINGDREAKREDVPQQDFHSKGHVRNEDDRKQEVEEKEREVEEKVKAVKDHLINLLEKVDREPLVKAYKAVN
jgi:hypothetical protein